jgi:hypothetical protein
LISGLLQKLGNSNEYNFEECINNYFNGNFNLKFVFFFIFSIYFSACSCGYEKSIFIMNKFNINQTENSLKNTFHLFKDSCENLTIEYIFISKAVHFNEKEYPVSYPCFVPLQTVTTGQTHAHLLSDCATRSGVKKENLILLCLFDGSIISNFFQSSYEKICIYEVNENVKKLKKEEENKNALNQNLEEQVCILNVKIADEIPVCVPFVFYCNSSLDDEVLLYILINIIVY